MTNNLLALALALAVSLPAAAAEVRPVDVETNALSGTDASEMLIPVAGRVAGARGEAFLTDLTVVNLGSRQETVALSFLPFGGTAQPVRKTITIESLQFITLVDVVGSFFERDALGAILIQSASANPGAAALDAHARVYTETTCDVSLQGTVNQGVPAILLSGWRNGSPALVHGARLNQGLLRTNYGLVNLEATPRQFRVIVNSFGGKAEEIVTVPGFGVLQRPVPQPVGGALSIFFEPLTPTGSWRGYASTIDNQSGSGYTIIATQPRQDVPR